MRDVPLTHVQRLLTDAVRRPAPGCPEAEALLAPSARGMTPAERLEVYREQFWLRHERNLADDYPTLAWAIGGAAAFAQLAREYLAAFPPRTWDLQRLGADVPAFVAAHAHHGGDAVARDAARLDWAFMEVFDAPDAAPFDPSVLASTPEEAWPGARVELHPSVRRLALGHPLLEVREAIKGALAAAATQGDVAATATQGDGAATATAIQPGGAPAAVIARPGARATHAIVWRDPACFSRAVEIEPEAFALLDRLARGEALGAACEAVARESAASEAELGERLGGWFQDWTARGFIARVVV